MVLIILYKTTSNYKRHLSDKFYLFLVIMNSNAFGGRGGTIRTALTSWFECIPQIGSRLNAMGAI